MKRAVIDIDGDETSHKRRRFNFTLPFSWKGDEAPYMGPIDLDYSLPDESESESCSGCTTGSSANYPRCYCFQYGWRNCVCCLHSPSSSSCRTISKTPDRECVPAEINDHDGDPFGVFYGGPEVFAESDEE